MLFSHSVDTFDQKRLTSNVEVNVFQEKVGVRASCSRMPAGGRHSVSNPDHYGPLL